MSFQMSAHLKQLLLMTWRRLVLLPVGLRKVQQGVDVQGITLQRAQVGPRQVRGNAGGKTWQPLRRTLLPVMSRQPGKPKPQTTSMSYLRVFFCSSSVCCLQSKDHTTETATPVKHPLTAALYLLLLHCQVMKWQGSLCCSLCSTQHAHMFCCSVLLGSLVQDSPVRTVNCNSPDGSSMQLTCPELAHSGVLADNA
jgi:hypothetical protein